jgi:hypothetical protein
MSRTPNIPTVILVHGGFADASFWGPVIKDLQGMQVSDLSRCASKRHSPRLDTQVVPGHLRFRGGGDVFLDRSHSRRVQDVAAPRTCR